MEWTTDTWLKRLYEQSEDKRRRSLEDGALKELRQSMLQALKRALGELPDRSFPLGARVLERKDYGDFVLERVSYSTMEALHVPVMVLLPKEGRGPWPAVLACHGHGNGQRDAAGLDPGGMEMDDPGIHNRFAVRLARQGMVVVIPEIMGFGVRRMAEELKANPNYSSCATLSAQLLMYGRTLAGMRVYEAMRAIDYLASREDVDAGRIGAFGFSGGGLIAAYMAALDERVKATVLCGWTNTFAGSILAMHHCIDNYIPGILSDAEQPDLTGLIAPRALFVESGERDPIFPQEHTRQAIAALRETYAAWGAAGQLGWDIHPEGHEISGRTSFGWLQRKLTE